MGRVLSGCRTVDGGSSGSLSTPCDCACEGCCCQHLIFSLGAYGVVKIDADWINFDGALLRCLGTIVNGVGTFYITDVRVWIEYCPPFPNDWDVEEDYHFASPVFGTPIEIPALAAPLDYCLTVILYDNNGYERTRCTVRIVE